MGIEVVVSVVGLLALGIWGRKFILQILLGSSVEKSDELKKEEEAIQKSMDEHREKMKKVSEAVHSLPDKEAFDELKKNIGG